jgi:hypothetical protein
MARGTLSPLFEKNDKAVNYEDTQAINSPGIAKKPLVHPLRGYNPHYRPGNSSGAAD